MHYILESTFARTLLFRIDPLQEDSHLNKFEYIDFCLLVRDKSLIPSPEHLDLDHDLYEYEQGLSSNIIVAGNLGPTFSFGNVLVPVSIF